MIRFENAIAPKMYYGLHMAEGVCEYRPPGIDPFRVLILENTLKKMDRTFQGKPVYVGHVDKEVAESWQNPDGYVIRSFFNKADGKHWVEFMVMTAKGQEHIEKGWKLSNAYLANPATYKGSGKWHAVDYAKEVMDAEYEHLAIVQAPRYEESIILTPEQFKKYNEDKEAQMELLANSVEKENKKQGAQGMLKFFKREKFENGADLESVMVELPKSKKEMTVADAITKLDNYFQNGYHCNGDEIVKVGENTMSVKELVEKHNSMEEEMKKAQNEADKEKKENQEDPDKKENQEDPDKKENEEDPDKKENQEDPDKKENEDDKKEPVANSMEYYRMKNAHEAPAATPQKLEMSKDQVARGKSKYGSN